MSELYELTAAALLPLFRQKSLSPVEVAKAVLARIERFDPHINATFDQNADSALQMARASEARWLKGAPCGSLDGVPATIKDNIAIQNRVYTLGTKFKKFPVPVLDSPPTARLREAGAVFIARTTIPDFGMLISGTSSLNGTTRNPWNTARNTGGSSSGAGASAAAGYGPLHLGTDIAGSVRMPASWCGVFGLKPSHGRVPVDPPFIARVTGPMTRTVTDAALLMQVLSRPDARDYMSLPPNTIDWLDIDRDGTWLRGLKIGLALDMGSGPDPDPEVIAAVKAAAKKFEDAGCVVEPLSPWLDEEGVDSFIELLRIRLRIELKGAPEEAFRDFPMHLRNWADGGRAKSAEDMVRQISRLFEVREKTVNATARYDFVLSPTATHTACKAEEHSPGNDVENSITHGIFTQAFSVSEQPAASNYCGMSSEGMPIGLQIAGRRFDDIGVLALSRAWEQLRGSEPVWPEPPSSTTERQAT